MKYSKAEVHCKSSLRQREGAYTTSGGVPKTRPTEGDFVIVHGRFSGFGQPVNWIAADIFENSF